MDFYKDLGLLYEGYAAYVRDMEREGKKPVSAFSYMMGNF